MVTITKPLQQTLTLVDRTLAKVSIIIPVYNEEKTLDAVLKKVQAISFPMEIKKEIIVVNDGSTDQTSPILQRFSQTEYFKVFHCPKNQGKTAAILKGLELATGNIITIQDADLEYDPLEIPKLVEPIVNNEVSVVYGSRFKGSIKDMKWINRVANIISNRFFNLLYSTNISDINTCHKVFASDVLKQFRIDSKDFRFETEITAKLIRQGYTILEIPINYVARSQREGKKINWPKALDMFWGIIKYRVG